MSTEVAVYQPGELAALSAMERAADFTTWAPKLAGAADIAREICQTDFVPAALRGKPAAVTAAIMAGSEMNLGPMASLMHVHIIEGRPSLSSEMQRALVLSLGHRIRYREMTVTRCVVDGQRRGEAEWTTVTWTMDDAKRASLEGRQNWKRYPRRMLAARATGELCRMLFADALAGMPYSAEELEDEADDTAAATAPAEPNGTAPKTRTARRRSTPSRPDPTPSASAPAAGNGRASGEARTAPTSSAADANADLPPLPGEDDQPDDSRHRKLVGTVRQHFKRLGFKEPEERSQRLVVTATIAGTPPIESTNDLGEEKLSAVADTLARCRDRDRLIALLAESSQDADGEAAE